MSADNASAWGLTGLIAAPRVTVRLAALQIFLLLGAACVGTCSESEIHLIPAGYEGPILIIFDDPAGVPERHERGKRVYAIPSNGVLRTRFGPNPGWGRPDYYYVDPAGRRTPVQRGGLCTDSVPGDVVRACRIAELSILGRLTPPYTSYVVGRNATYGAAQTRLESLVLAEVFRDSASTPSGAAGRRKDLNNPH
jgi:uncharacterized protein DUF6843